MRYAMGQVHPCLWRVHRLHAGAIVGLKTLERYLRLFFYDLFRDFRKENNLTSRNREC